MAFNSNHPWRLANPPQDVAFTKYTWPSAGITTRVGRWHDGTVIIPLREVVAPTKYQESRFNQWAVSVRGFHLYHARDVGPTGDNKPVRCVSAADAKEAWEWLQSRKGKRGAAATPLDWTRKANIPRAPLALVDLRLHNLELGKYLVRHSSVGRTQQRIIPEATIPALRPVESRPEELYIRLYELAKVCDVDPALARKRMAAYENTVRALVSLSGGKPDDVLLTKFRRLWMMTRVKRNMYWGKEVARGRPTSCWPAEYAQEIVDVITNPKGPGISYRLDSASNIHPLAGAMLTAEGQALRDRNAQAREGQQALHDTVDSPLASQIDDALAGFGLLHS